MIEFVWINLAFGQVGEQNYGKDWGYSRKITQINVKGFNDIFNKDTKNNYTK